MKKLAFPLCYQNLLRVDEYAVHKFINPIFSDFYFAHVIGNIVIISNCRAQANSKYYH